MPKPAPAPARQIARLERAAVILERFHLELSAHAPSARTTRLLRANRNAAEVLQERMEKARRAIAAGPADSRSANAVTPAKRQRPVS